MAFSTEKISPTVTETLLLFDILFKFTSVSLHPNASLLKKKEGKKEHRKEEEKNRFKGRKLQSFPPYHLHLFLLLVLRDQILGPAFGSCQSHASL